MPAPLYTAAGFDKAAIMRAAWATFRQTVAELTATTHRDDLPAYLEGEFAKSLRMAWIVAKREKAEAERAAAIQIIPRAERLDRAAKLERTAYGIDCADRDGSRMAGVAAMRAEAYQLRAA